MKARRGLPVRSRPPALLGLDIATPRPSLVVSSADISSCHGPEKGACPVSQESPRGGTVERARHETDSGPMEKVEDRRGACATRGFSSQVRMPDACGLEADCRVPAEGWGWSQLDSTSPSVLGFWGHSRVGADRLGELPLCSHFGMPSGEWGGASPPQAPGLGKWCERLPALGQPGTRCVCPPEDAAPDQRSQMADRAPASPHAPWKTATIPAYPE